MSKSNDKKKQQLKELALRYHLLPKPGKLSITATTPMETQHDLSLAYSPGVAFACEEIVADPANAALYTSRANLAAVITNGTAVLGLGDIGPLASKPVMEGKAVLFKKFANVDVFDIEVNEKDPDKFIEVVKSLEPTFGAINLEDIKSPECFYIEERLKKEMNIPVFHDDQHGTAIIVAAAIKNALELVGKDIKDVKLVTSGAGAAAMACVNLINYMGVPAENIYLTDRTGLVTKDREDIDKVKARYAKDSNDLKDIKGLNGDQSSQIKLVDVIGGADILLGLSAAGVVSADMVAQMADKPIIMALANPVPEITPEEVRKVRSDAIIATGRTDYPNQVNNVLCFPFIFRGALDVQATEINEEMKLACVNALAEMAKEEVPEIVAKAYKNNDITFGPNYIIPKPFDPRLISRLAPAVAKAAMESGVAKKPIEDIDKYARDLERIAYKSAQVMTPIFDLARSAPKRVAFSNGEDERVLRAAQALLDEGMAEPILVGRRRVIEMRLKKYNLHIEMDKDFQVVDPEDDPRYKLYWTTYYNIMKRRGVNIDTARQTLHTNPTVIGALMVYLNDADALIAGSNNFIDELRPLIDILGTDENSDNGQENDDDKIKRVCSMGGLITNDGLVFVADPFVNIDPTVEELEHIVDSACSYIRFFGLEPKVALTSHSRFGSGHTKSAKKMHKVSEILRNKYPDMEIDGEMHAAEALDPELMQRVFPESKLKSRANLIIAPNIDAANISLNMSKILTKSQLLGPILMGLKYPAHIMASTATTRSIINMAALAVVEAQKKDKS